MKNIPKTIAILFWTIPTLLMLFGVLIYINNALATRILANSSYPPPGEQYVVTPDSYQNYKVVLPLVIGEPPYTTSYYMNTVDSNILYDMGCELGERDRNISGNQNNVIILDFGYPYLVSNVYGTISSEIIILFQPPTLVMQ